ncbi:hypothetical protein BS78_07G015200 [Paspalum vaginatum]|nr:hypothetical protein BS78_07G015200 [Paspalum vaginatum]
MPSKVSVKMSGTNGNGAEVTATMASGGEEGKRDGNSLPVESKIGTVMSGANAGSDDGGGGGNAAVACDLDAPGSSISSVQVAPLLRRGQDVAGDSELDDIQDRREKGT